MVAVHPHLAVLAISLASLGLLAPSADAAAIRARSSQSGASSKHTRQLPMPLRSRKTATRGDLKSKHGRGFGEPRRSKFHKSRAIGVGGRVSKRQNDQAHFSVKNLAARRLAEARDSSQCDSGRIDVTNATSDGTTTTYQYLASLFLNSTAQPYPVLDASTTKKTIFDRVLTDDSHCTLQKEIYDPTQNTTSLWCATYCSRPSAPEPLVMRHCFDPSTPPEPCLSQIFSWDQKTGVVQPVWSNPPDDSTNVTSASVDAQDVNDNDGGGDAYEEDTGDEDGDATDDGDDDDAADNDWNASANLTTRRTQRLKRDAQQMDVTLIFSPECPVEPVNAQGVSTDSSPSSSASPVAETDTVTATVTATVYPTFAAAAADGASTTTGSAVDSSAIQSDYPASTSLVQPSASDAPTADALDVEVNAAPSSTISADSTPSSDFSDPAPTNAAPTDNDASTLASDSSVPSTSSTDPAPTDDDVATSASDSSVPSSTSSTDPAPTDNVAATDSATPSFDSSVPSPTPVTDAAVDSSSPVAPPASEDQAVYVGSASERRR